MIAEHRTYTINGGMLDSYLELYNMQIVPNHRKYGIQVLGAWVNRSQNEVVWIRLFESREDRKQKLDIYEVSPERDAVFPIAAYHMAKAEVKILEDAFNPASVPDDKVLHNEVAKRAVAVAEAADPKAFAAFKAATAAPR
jgi:hypothetical protein